MGETSLARSVIAAACAHALVVLALLRVHGAPTDARRSEAPPDELFEVSEQPSQAPLASTPEDVTAPGPALRSVRPATPSAAPPMPSEASSSSLGSPSIGVAPAGASSAEPWSFAGSAPVALGIGDYWKTAAMAAGSAAPRESHDAPARPADHILRDGLLAADRARGLGAAGPLVSAAHEAASPSIAPDVGAATLEIDCDADGKVVAARVLPGSGDTAKWNAVAREVVRLTSARTVRVPAGAHGVRTRLRIVAERALPSGSKRTASPGAVPDDVAGGVDKACVGEGSARKCGAGMPVGVTGTLGDLANIGAKASRIVHVLVLGEETL